MLYLVEGDNGVKAISLKTERSLTDIIPLNLKNNNTSLQMLFFDWSKPYQEETFSEVTLYCSF